MTIKIQPNGAYTGAGGLSGVLRAIAQTQAATVLKAAAVTDLTDNSAGVAGQAIALPKELSATAQNGSNLAGKATFEAALITVVAGIAEVGAKANTMATAIGVDLYVDATTPTNDGTIGAITKTVTGATTGALVDNTNAIITNVNNYLTTVTEVVNGIAGAVGVKKVRLTGLGKSLASVPAVSTNTGTAAAAPAVSKADADALLTVYANAVASLAAKLTACNAVTTKPKVLAV